MKLETAERLFREYGQFFQHRGDPARSLMHWGFGIGEGWANLVEAVLAAAADLEANLETVVHIDDNPSMPRVDLEIVQVKEKFGELRIYADGSADIQSLIDMASWLSTRTCEVCGRPAQRESHGGWLNTLCQPCRQAAQATQNTP